MQMTQGPWTGRTPERTALGLLRPRATFGYRLAGSPSVC